MGKGGGGQADPSGMYAAMASAQAAQQEYALGKEQLDWAKQVWAQEQPLVTQGEQLQIQASQADIAAQQQAQQFAQEQEQVYNQYFLPMEKQYAGQAANWASPANMALYQGQAQNNVAEQMTNELNTAKEQLQAYGVNPDAPRYAGLYVGQNALSGAAQAGAGTTAAQNLRLQQMGLEQNALNIGAGLGNSSAQLTNAGTGAGSGAISGGSGAAATGQSNLSTGSQAMTAPTAWYNSGAQNMGVYTNAVGQYNQSQADFARANAAESSGFGALAGGVMGDVFGAAGKAGGFGALFAGFDKGGGVTRYEDGGGVDLSPGPTVTYPTGQSQQIMMGPSRYEPMTATARQQNDVGPIYSRTTGRGILNDPRAAPFADPRTFPAWKQYDDGGGVSEGYPQGDFIGGDERDQMNAAQPPLPPQGAQYPGDARNLAIPPGPDNPFDPGEATPGGGVPAGASPSRGAVTDDVPAQLTAHEFVIPKDVAVWKGHEYFTKQIDQARKALGQNAQRPDIGGEPAAGIPAQPPRFVSRPMHTGSTAMPLHMSGLSGIPPHYQQQQA